MTNRAISVYSELANQPIIVPNTVKYIMNIRGPRVQLLCCRSLFPYSLAQYNDSICSWLALLTYPSADQMRHYLENIFRSTITISFNRNFNQNHNYFHRNKFFPLTYCFSSRNAFQVEYHENKLHNRSYGEIERCVAVKHS